MGEKTQILIVEDNPVLRMSLDDILKTNGYATIAAPDGGTALSIIEEQSPAVAMIDLKLKGMSGMELLAKVKTHYPVTECILITGHSSQDSAIEAIKLGAYGYILKPYDVDELLLTTQRAVEKRNTEIALRESEERFRTMAQSAIAAIITIDSEGLIRFFNRAAERIFGYSAGEMVGRNLDVLIPEEYRKSHKAALRHYLDTRQAKVIGKTVVMKGLRKGGEIFPLELSLSEVEVGSKITFTAIIRDITERVRAAETLVQHAEEMEALYATSLEINAQPDLTSLLSAIVKRAAMLLETEIGRLLLIQPDGETLKIVASHNYQTGDELHLGQGLAGRVAQTGEPLMVSDYSRWEGRMDSPVAGSIGRILGVPLKRRDRVIGVLTVLDAHKTGEFTESQIRLLDLFAAQAAIAIEKTRLFEQVRNGRERMKSLSTRLLEVQEAERQHLARELHDEVSQTLTGLKLTLRMSQHQTGESLRQAKLDIAMELIDELSERVENLSLDLRPSMLDDLGLLPALLWHIERFTTLTNVQVVFKHTGIEGRRFAPEKEIAAYRIVQEALTNVARYARVNQAEVRLWANSDLIGIQIEDKGKSFDPESVLAAGRTSGLAGMRERAVLLAGRLIIESSPNLGTCLSAELPLGEPLERRSKERPA